MTSKSQENGWSCLGSATPGRALATLAIALILTGISLIYSVTTLRINTDTTDMIAADVPFRQNHLALKEAFPAFKETIVAVIDGATPEASLEAAEDLAEALSSDKSHFAHVQHIGGDPFFARHGLLYLDIDTLTTLSDRLAEAQPLLAALAADPNLDGLSGFIELALTESDDLPQGLDDLLGQMAEVTEAAIEDRRKDLSWIEQLDLGGRASGKRQILIAEPVIDYGSLAPAASVIDAVRRHAKEQGIGDQGQPSLRLTGSAVIEHEELASVSSGAVWAGVTATAGVALLLVWGLGSIRLIIATLGTLIIGLIITAGLATLVIGRLNLISVTFAVLFVGLGVDFGIHLTLRYKEEIQRQLEHKDALRRALSAVGGPLSLSALCAGLGFIAFAPTDYQGLAELGMISAIGMAVAWASSLWVLPALLTLMSLQPSEKTPAQTASGPAWTERFASPILGIALIAAVSSVPLLTRVSFDFNPLNLKDPESESVATFLDLERNPDTASNLVSVLASDLVEADRMAEGLRQVQGIGDVITLSSFVPGDQDEKLGVIEDTAFFLGPLEPPSFETIGDDERLAAFERLRAALQEHGPGVDSGAGSLVAALDNLAAKIDGKGASDLIDLEERLTRYLPSLLQKLDLALQAGEVTLESLPDTLRTDWINENGEAKVLARPAIGIQDNRSLERFADAALGEVRTATGTPVIITEAGRVVVSAFTEASLIAFSLITIVLILVLRRLVDVLMVLVPLALAIVYTGATSVLLGLQLNFANVIVLPLLLGLGVSGAVHVVMRRRAIESADAIPGQSSTRRAVFFSALTTVASFGSLAISPHLGMASMGLLLTVAILWSLVCTLVILPALFALFDSTKGVNP